MALRACGGSIDQAISSIIETRCKQEEGRKQSRKEHHLMDSIGKSKDKNWVNPRTLCTLVDMGFRKELCVSALQLTDNNMDQAVGIFCAYRLTSAIAYRFSTSDRHAAEQSS